MTENYTNEFVRVLSICLLNRPTHGVNQTSHAKEIIVLVGDPVPICEDSKLIIAIKTLHSNLGHPSSRALARAIKLSGDSDETVSAVLAFRCPTCVQLKEPKPANAGQFE